MCDVTNILETMIENHSVTVIIMLFSLSNQYFVNYRISASNFLFLFNFFMGAVHIIIVDMAI